MSQLADIRNALKSLLTSMRTTNGYSQNLLPANYKENYDEAALATSKDSDYPKLFLLSAAGNVDPQPSARFIIKRTFMVVIILKQTVPNGPSIATQVDDVVDDVQTLLESDPTLGGKVEMANMLEFSTDSGTLYPEAAAAITVQVTYLRE